MCYHLVDTHGAHRLVSINDQAVRDFHGDREAFERHLAARYRSFELVGSCKGIINLAHQTATFEVGTHELKITTPPHDHPSAPSESRGNVNKLLVAISSAIFNRIAPVVAGTLKQGGAAELVGAR